MLSQSRAVANWIGLFRAGFMGLCAAPGGASLLKRPSSRAAASGETNARDRARRAPVGSSRRSAATTRFAINSAPPKSVLRLFGKHDARRHLISGRVRAIAGMPMVAAAVPAAERKERRRMASASPLVLRRGNATRLHEDASSLPEAKKVGVLLEMGRPRACARRCLGSPAGGFEHPDLERTCLGCAGRQTCTARRRCVEQSPRRRCIGLIRKGWRRGWDSPRGGFLTY